MKITVLGLGAMGSRMAERLIAGGHDVTVWNRSAGAAEAFKDRATIAATPGEAAKGAEIVLGMVRDDAAARDVWFGERGALATMTAGAIAIESSTVTPAQAEAFHATAAKHGVDALDAPVSGSLAQAAAGHLIFLVGGDAAVLERATPALNAMGSAIHHVGAAEAGCRIKLAINALLGVQVAAGAELLGMLAAQGIAMDKAAEVIGSVPVASLALRNYMTGMATGQFPPMFPVAMIDKDLGYAEAMAAGAPLPVTAAAHEVYRRGGAAGLAAENMNAVIKLYR